MDQFDPDICYRALQTRDPRFDGRFPTAAAAQVQRAQAWRPWRAYAAQYLWIADSAAVQNPREACHAP